VSLVLHCLQLMRPFFVFLFFIVYLAVGEVMRKKVCDLEISRFNSVPVSVLSNISVAMF
jgi:hypothetical protein